MAFKDIDRSGDLVAGLICLRHLIALVVVRVELKLLSSVYINDSFYHVQMIYERSYI